MYGTQTCRTLYEGGNGFENDVKMYGTQTKKLAQAQVKGLRMM